jgi:hypothetical protein
MIKCPKCGKEIRYITAERGQPIPVDDKICRLIAETGRIIHGYKEHKCPEKAETDNGGGA